MSRILLAGFDDAFAAQVRRRLGVAAVCAAQSAQQTLEALAASRWSLLIVNDRVGAAAAEEVLRSARSESGPTDVRTVCCLEPGHEADLPTRLVDELGVSELLFQPLDPEALSQQLAAILGIAPRPAADEAVEDRPLTAALASLWEQLRGPIVERIAVFDAVSAALRDGTLSSDLRRSAKAEAHTLTGSVGTVGFLTAARLARELDDRLRPGAPLGAADAAVIAELTSRLRRELDQAPLEPTAEPPPHDGRPLLLIVDDDLALVRGVAMDATRRGMRVETAGGVSTARATIARACPDLVLLDLSFPEETEDGLALLAELTDHTPPVPVLVLTARDGLLDRVEVARRGGRGFLQKPLPAAQVVDAIAYLLARLQAADATVLAVDDDPQILAMLRTLLEPKRIRLTTLDDPLRFWEALEEAAPDLMLLDVEMPHLSGIELCRVVRNDARWGGLPILFLTGRTDRETVQQLFAAGADDYVTKPIVGAELVTRILNRLERTQLLRTMSETDPLTGVANRRKATQSLEQLLRLANRHRQPFALALLDLDRFKHVNDHHGHATGDAVLHRLAELLLRSFRGDDVVARWGGEEFLVGMYGMTRDDGVARLADVLEQFGRERFSAPPRARFSATFSAGVAEYPWDGSDLGALYRAADRAMYRAKRAGRCRVLPVDRCPDQEQHEPDDGGAAGHQRAPASHGGGPEWRRGLR